MNMNGGFVGVSLLRVSNFGCGPSEITRAKPDFGLILQNHCNVFMSAF